MREALFEGAGVRAGPMTLCVESGSRYAFVAAGRGTGAVIAMMAAGIVKPSRGRVFIGAFDPRIQPVQAKRLAGFVPHEAVPHQFASFTQYIEYRAALWGLPRAQSIVRARAILTRLEGVHEAFAYPLIGALLAAPRLLVLDRPQAAYASQIAIAAEGCAIFSTHAGEREADRFESAAADVPA